jgi:ATP synthase protein I
MTRSEDEQLKLAAMRDVQRLQQQGHKHSMLRYSVFLGGLASMMVVPVIGGAYLGRWLDSQYQGYSTRWTVSMIVIGIAMGTYNIWHTIRNRK